MSRCGGFARFHHEVLGDVDAGYDHEPCFNGRGGAAWFVGTVLNTPIYRRRLATNQPLDGGVRWGRGIQLQGKPWEDYLEKQLSPASRRPKNFKAFDFFSEETGVAISAKTLDTTTVARLKQPTPVCSALVRSIEAAAHFTSYELKGVALSGESKSKRSKRCSTWSTTRRNSHKSSVLLSNLDPWRRGCLTAKWEACGSRPLTAPR